MNTRAFLPTQLARMHDVLAGYVERRQVPGFAALVCKYGELHVDVHGSLDQAGTRPLQRDSIFRISSMTKPVTALAAMILVEECKLRLDESLDALLPELAERQVLARVDGPLSATAAARRAITLRDLLTFTLGFGQLMASPDTHPILQAAAELALGLGPPAPAAMPAPDEWLRRFSTLPLMYQPGERWLYNTGSDLLGIVIARAAGQDFPRFLRERIFEPLGMKDTGFFVPQEQLDRLSSSYWTRPKSGELQLFEHATESQWSRPPAFPSGASGLVSTLDDYYAFAQMMLNGGALGRTRIVSRPTIALMTSDQLSDEQKLLSGFGSSAFALSGYGFGVSVVTRRAQLAESVGTYGWDGGLGSCWRNDPQENMVTILMTQAAWTSPKPPNICLDFWTSAYQAIAS